MGVILAGVSPASVGQVCHLSTVIVGLIENRTQEGTHRFYRFRTPLRGRTHRFYWVAPFLSMVHVTSSSSNRPKLAKRTRTEGGGIGVPGEKGRKARMREEVMVVWRWIG